MDITEDQELNLKMAAEVAGHTPQSLLYHIKTYPGKLPFRIVAGRKLFRLKDVLAWKATRDR